MPPPRRKTPTAALARRCCTGAALRVRARLGRRLRRGPVVTLRYVVACALALAALYVAVYGRAGCAL